nr:hypothetical protein [Wolbachia endosymbiont of Ctenocephalides felis wCfeJ]
MDPEYAKRRKASEEGGLMWEAYHFGTREDGRQ